MDVESLKVPPHSIEAEQAVLGSLMLSNPDAILDMIPLSMQSFYRREHQLIYKGILNLVKDKQGIDCVTLSDYLKSTGKLDEVGGLAYLAELANQVPYCSHINSYASIVQEKHILRQLLQASTEIADDVLQDTGKTSSEILDTADRKIFEITKTSSFKEKGPESIQNVLARAINDIEARQLTEGLTGLSTGFKDLDELTNGLHAGELIIVAGRPSMGKTSFGMNIAEYASIRSDKAVLVFSLEMSIEDLGLRMISSLGRIDQSKLRSNKMNDADWARCSHAVGLFKESKLFIDENSSTTHEEIRFKSRQLARELELGLVVIDYLSLIPDPPRCDSKVSAIGEITKSLKALAKELKVPIILLSQLNRNLDHRPNKRPIMSDLRESGAIEQDADVIMFIYRDEFYNEDSPDKGVAEIIIGKHRNGPTGTIKLTFVGHCTRFDNYMTDRHLRVV